MSGTLRTVTHPALEAVNEAGHGLERGMGDRAQRTAHRPILSATQPPARASAAPAKTSRQACMGRT